MSVDALLSRLSHVKPSGKDRWRAQCPLHDKGKDALAIRDDGGHVLLHCFSCEGGAVAICEAIGLDIGEIMPDVDKYAVAPGKPIAKPWPSRMVLEALHRDLRLSYVLYNDIATGRLPLEITQQRAIDAKKRIGHLISELDRAY